MANTVGPRAPRCGFRTQKRRKPPDHPTCLGPARAPLWGRVARGRGVENHPRTHPFPPAEAGQDRGTGPVFPRGSLPRLISSGPPRGKKSAVAMGSRYFRGAKGAKLSVSRGPNIARAVRPFWRGIPETGGAASDGALPTLYGAGRCTSSPFYSNERAAGRMVVRRRSRFRKLFASRRYLAAEL